MFMPVVQFHRFADFDVYCFPVVFIPNKKLIQVTDAHHQNAAISVI